MVVREKRKDSRKEFSQEIRFESMTNGREGTIVFCQQGRCQDISNGGLGILISCKPIAGEILKLLVPFTNLDITVPVFAEVIWMTPIEDHYRAGMRFLA